MNLIQKLALRSLGLPSTLPLQVADKPLTSLGDDLGSTLIVAPFGNAAAHDLMREHILNTENAVVVDDIKGELIADGTAEARAKRTGRRYARIPFGLPSTIWHDIQGELLHGDDACLNPFDLMEPGTLGFAGDLGSFFDGGERFGEKPGAERNLYVATGLHLFALNGRLCPADIADKLLNPSEGVLTSELTSSPSPTARELAQGVFAHDAEVLQRVRQHWAVAAFDETVAAMPEARYLRETTSQSTVDVAALKNGELDIYLVRHPRCSKAHGFVVGTLLAPGADERRFKAEQEGVADKVKPVSVVLPDARLVPIETIRLLATWGRSGKVKAVVRAESIKDLGGDALLVNNFLNRIWLEPRDEETREALTGWLPATYGAPLKGRFGPQILVSVDARAFIRATVATPNLAFCEGFGGESQTVVVLGASATKGKAAK